MTCSKKLANDLIAVVLSVATPVLGLAVVSEVGMEPRTALAQDVAPAVTAELVAARVQAFYDQTRTVEARFQQHFWIRAHGRTQSSRGTLVIQRPGRIRFDYAQPRGKVVVSTPAGYVFFEPGDDGSPGQFMRGSSEGASAALGFLTGTARLDRDFRLALRTVGAAAPEHTDGLELRPRRADPHFRRVVLYVDNRPDTLGVVRRVSIEDPDGNWNRFDFSELRFNRDVAASTFEFQPPANARELTAPGSPPSPSPASPTRGTAPATTRLPAPGSSG